MLNDCQLVTEVVINGSKLQYCCILNTIKLIGRMAQSNYLPPRDRVIIESNNTSSGDAKKDSPTNVNTENGKGLYINAFFFLMYFSIFSNSEI